MAFVFTSEKFSFFFPFLVPEKIQECSKIKNIPFGKHDLHQFFTYKKTLSFRKGFLKTILGRSYFFTLKAFSCGK